MTKARAVTFIGSCQIGWTESRRSTPLGGCDFFNPVAGKLRRASANKHRRGPSPQRCKSCVKHRSARRFAQDDDSVVGIKNIGSSAKNTKRSKKSQALPRQAGAGRMTILWEN